MPVRWILLRTHHGVDRRNVDAGPRFRHRRSLTGRADRQSENNFRHIAAGKTEAPSLSNRHRSANRETRLAHGRDASCAIEPN
jgi:hypothetical protein